MGCYRRKTHKRENVYTPYEKDLKNLVKRELTSFMEDVEKDQYINPRTEGVTGELRSCMICGRFEYDNRSYPTDEPFKCTECRHNFERFKKDLDYEYIDKEVDELLGIGHENNKKVSVVTYKDALDIAINVLKEIKSPLRDITNMTFSQGKENA